MRSGACLNLRSLRGALLDFQIQLLQPASQLRSALSIEENAIHGSDAEDTAAFEIGYWFAGYELI